VPVGFITNELQSERDLWRRADEPVLPPSGFITMLLTDVERSTALVHRLGDDYGDLIDRLRALLRDTALGAGGHVVEARADEFFAVFEQPAAALAMALSVPRELLTRASAGEEEVRVRIGIHSGFPTRARSNYIGMAVHTAARICDAAHGGQISCQATSAPRSASPSRTACAYGGSARTSSVAFRGELSAGSTRLGRGSG
jgi:class 3 adenylate cyclase